MRMGQLLCKRTLPHGMTPGCRVDPALNFAREFNPAKAVSIALLMQEARPLAVRGIRDGCKNAHMFFSVAGKIYCKHEHDFRNFAKKNS